MTYTSTQSLIITIIVLLILSGASISMIAGDNGILTRSSDAKTQTVIASKKEEVAFAISELMVENNADKSKITITALVNKIKGNYSLQQEKNSIDGETTGEEEDKFPAEITYKAPVFGIVEDIVISVDENLSITGAKTAEPDQFSNIEKVVPKESTYQKNGHIYYNSPDLSGFNPEATYYVTYDTEGTNIGKNPKIAGRIDRVEAPTTGWHDYEKGLWANVVTVTGNEVTYWTWIPRFKYLTPTQDSTITAQTSEVKFVRRTDEGIDECWLWDETQGDYEFTARANGKTLASDYKLSDAFKFDTENLKGYWVSKYDVQESGLSGIERLSSEVDGKKITVNTSNSSGNKYTIYVQGTEYATGVSLPYTVKGLKANKQYDICVYNETKQVMVGRTTGLTSDIIEVDLSGFNPENTYYVLYGNGNNGTIGERIQLDSNGNATNIPKGWYDYDNKIWANIVTVTGNDVTYWTYIPRFEYAAGSSGTTATSIVKYIKSTQKNPDGGMVLSNAFKFGDKDLKGYWVSKYDVQVTGLADLETIYSEVKGSKVTVSTSAPSGNYTIYLNGERYKEHQTLPQTIDVGSNKEYDIMLINETANRVVGNTKGLSSNNIEIDLSGFNAENTYYVLYDADGKNEIIGDKIQVDAKGNGVNPQVNNKIWYNYDRKLWANVVTKGKDSSGNDLISYWTYIPRFQYLAVGDKKSIVQYMKSTDKVENPLKFPDSFTFGGKDLKGYWVSKYDVQGTTN